MLPVERICYSCKVSKPLDRANFYMKNGKFKRQCKECEKAYMVSWKALNPQYKSDYYLENRESELSRIKAWQNANPERVKDNNKSRDHLGRAGGEGDRITLSKLAERDEFICGICLEMVDMNLKYPESMSASIDHIILISKGGPHTWENVRLSHLICNLKRPKKSPVVFEGLS